jgi:dsDNA-specific endonuclease/ATPase MutS2
MATTVERLGIVETKVENINEKVDELKTDIKDVHDCLDRTGENLKTQLEIMHQDSCQQHQQLSAKIVEMEKAKDKLMLYGAIGAAFIAGAGWSGAINFPMIMKFFGL